ncbi:MAG: CotH kinase family protein, partial [Lachnospiraceae bacterium]|nr:CotH kinase family protein [Lachnospiraceae bacterium]
DAYGADVKDNNISDIPILQINTNKCDMEDINHNKKIDVKGKYVITNKNGHIYNEGDFSSFKGRGNYTWNNDGKKPYNIILSESDSLLEMPESINWCLIANAYDISLMRNYIVYNFADDMGMEYTPDVRYVNLYINDEYAGLYLLSEKHEVASNKIDLSEDGVLYQLYPKSRNPEIAFELNDSTRLMAIDYPYEFKGDTYGRCKDYIDEFEEALYSDDGINSKGKRYDEYIDMESFAKKYLIEEMFANWDGTYASQLFFRKNSSDVLHAGPVWDYDLSMGSISGLGTESIQPNVKKADAWWYKRLCTFDDFMEKVKEVYINEFASAYENISDTKIDEYTAHIKEAAAMDTEKWYADGSRIAYDEDAEKIKTFIKERKEFLDDWLINGREYVKVYVKYYDEEGTEHTDYYSCKKGEKLEDFSDRYEKTITDMSFDNGSKYDFNDVINNDVAVHIEFEKGDTEKGGLLNSISTWSKQNKLTSDLILAFIPFIIVYGMILIKEYNLKKVTILNL